ncbi:MAG: hypothetical protein QNJ72_03505 [Pleurocapsa sp. MO_226.B13]|nr:hypothetical protein [Pleurocapsa sp. MO_226.B13]
MWELEPVSESNNKEQFAESLARKKDTYTKWKNIIRRLSCKITLNQYEEKLMEDFARRVEGILKNAMGFYSQRS